MKIRKCKGMKDLSPEDMVKFRAVEKTCRETLAGWGYREVRTPALENLHLFTSAGTLTPAQLGKVYSFLDWDGWSGERVVLRPDGTIPVARLYTETTPGEPARLFYSTNVFMFEDGSDKARERWQCGGELIGPASPAADAELVSLSLEILGKLGFPDVSIRLSHAGVVRAILEKLGLDFEEQHKVFDRILDGDSEALASVGKQSPDLAQALEMLINLKGKSQGFLKNQQSALPASLADLKPCLEDFSRSAAALDELGINYEIDIASGAGFEYYTGMLFQLFIGDRKVGGGGRYDALILAMGGGDIPAAGFALYLTTVLQLSGAPKSREPGRVVVLGDNIKAVFNAAAEIRRAGFITEIGTGKTADANTAVVEVENKNYRLDTGKGPQIAGSLPEVLRRLEAAWPSR